MFKNPFDLTGRRIRVTGSDGGIGNSLALGLAQHGATVILNGRNPHKLQINSIGPGYFITEMTQVLAANPQFDAWVKSRTPAQRWGRPEELVGSAVFLSSAASDFVNGQMVYVDGGMISVL